MLRSIAAAAVAFGTCFAVQTANACPESFKRIDSDLWEEARKSGEPSRWVQYLVAAQCPENKPAARALLQPILGVPGGGGSALDQILLMGKFSGDQTHTVEKAKNGFPLKPSGQGGELITFQLLSVTKVAKVANGEIPKSLFDTMDPKLPDGTPRDVALWIRYRCHVHNTNTFTDWVGDPKSDNTPPPECAPKDYVIRTIEVQLMGPYAKFFEQPPTVSVQAHGSGGAYSLVLTVRLKPQYTSFMGMLTGNYVK